MENITCICYFGIYPPTIARNKVLVDGLRENGLEVIECFDQSSSYIRKVYRLFCKLRSIRGDYDMVLVGYLSGIVVWLAKLCSRKPIVYNALNSSYEGVVLDRGYKKISFLAFKCCVIDFFSFFLSDVVLVESDAQADFISRLFFVPKRKLVRVWTGADPTVFYPNPSIQRNTRFTAVFRGGFLPATGVEYVVRAAKLLEKFQIDVVILGRGMLLNDIEKLIQEMSISNIRLVTDVLTDEDLRTEILRCHVMLGQFSRHDRLDRTIQNKTFEALAMGMPYVTRDSVSNREVLTDRMNCLFVQPENPNEIAEAVVRLRDDEELRKAISDGAYRTFLKELSPREIGVSCIQGAQKILNLRR